MKKKKKPNRNENMFVRNLVVVWAVRKLDFFFQMKNKKIYNKYVEIGHLSPMFKVVSLYICVWVIYICHT